MTQYWLCILLGLCGLVTSCRDVSSYATPQQTPPTPNIIVREVTTSKSSNLVHGWKHSEKLISGGQDFQTIQFVNRSQGWVGSGKGSLYKTNDGGNTWKKVNLPKSGDFISVSFVDSSIGWVFLEKTSSSFLDYQENHIWIMKTQDGGESWETQYEQQAAGLRRIAFINTQEGWAVGIRTVELKPINQVNFVLHTKDGGHTWADVSNTLNLIAANKEGRVQDHLTDIQITESDSATVLSLRGKIFRTNDSGNTWQAVTYLPDEPAQTCICHLFVDSKGTLKVAGGADSSEGMWGMVALKNDDTWVRYRHPNFYLEDIAYLSSQEIIAAGSIPGSSKESVSTTTREGVIISSSDGGQSWAYIYRNPRVESIKALSIINPTLIRAVPEKGIMVQLVTQRK